MSPSKIVQGGCTSGGLLGKPPKRKPLKLKEQLEQHLARRERVVATPSSTWLSSTWRALRRDKSAAAMATAATLCSA